MKKRQGMSHFFKTKKLDLTRSLLPMNCSHPNMLTKNRIAGMLQVMPIIAITLFPVRHARYLAAILTEQNLSTVISRTVNWDTRHTV